MGEIRIRCRLWGSPKAGKRSRGTKEPRNGARTVDALVDTDAVEVLLPRDLVHALGLSVFGRARVTLADERRASMPVAGPLWLSAFGRAMITDCLVGPVSGEPLVGQLVPERLDLVLDPRQHAVAPRVRSGPVLKLK